LFVRTKIFTTNLISLFCKKTSPFVRVIFLGNHPTVKTAKHEFKNGVRFTKSHDTKKLLASITAISVFLTDRCQDGEMTQN